MESEEVMTSSVTSNSSDNESWTILEEEPEENPIVQARIDVIQAVAEFTKKSLDPPESSESDIERIDEAEGNLESLTSDGIPVGEDLSCTDQYIWSSEADLTSSTATDETEVPQKTASDPLCPSGYPPFELMDRFSEIKKGRTYLHQPNQALNLYLTGTLVIVFTLVIGLGVGHFKGWSERLELQEQYADVREERMDELTDSLVSCMTKSQDDQDLDDQVIRQLRDENDRLKSELQLLRNTYDLDNSATEEMNVILRDRINHLLTAKADLEKEVAKLRYAAPPIVVTAPPSGEMLQTKESLNRIMNENEQLRIAIGKERYGPRQVPIEQKEALNILKTENDELKTEVRKFRYGVHDVQNVSEPNFVTLGKIQPKLPPVIHLSGDIDKSEHVSNKIDQVSDTMEQDSYQIFYVPGFATPVRRFSEDIDKSEHVSNKIDQVSDKMEQDFEEDEGFVEDFDETEQDFASSNESEHDCTSSDEFDQEDLEDDDLELLQPVQDVIEEFTELLPDKSQLDQAAKTIQTFGQSIHDTWNDMKNDNFDIKDKLKETLNKVYTRANEEFNPKVWNERSEKFQEKFNKISDKVSTNWSKVQHKVEKKVKNLQNDFKKTWKDMENKFKDKYWSSKKERKEHKKERKEHKKERKERKEHEEHPYSSWSKKNSSSMVFARAKNRDKLRKEQTRSDWLFDRANDRKRHQKLLSEAEWYNRRALSKHCDEDGCKTIDKDVPHYTTSQKKQKYSVKTKLGETGPLNSQKSKFSAKKSKKWVKDSDEDDDFEEDFKKSRKQSKNFKKYVQSSYHKYD